MPLLTMQHGLSRILRYRSCASLITFDAKRTSAGVEVRQSFMHPYHWREMRATWQFHSPASSPSEIHPTGPYCTEDWMGPNADLDDIATNRQFSAPARNCNPVFWPVRHSTDWPTWLVWLSSAILGQNILVSTQGTSKHMWRLGTVVSQLVCRSSLYSIRCPHPKIRESLFGLVSSSACAALPLLHNSRLHTFVSLLPYIHAILVNYYF